MEWLFGKQKTPQEMLRENQRMLRKSIREIDRERMALENQEKKAIIEIRKMAKQNQMAAAKILAKDLVRTRAHIKKFITMRTQLQAVSTRLQVSVLSRLHFSLSSSLPLQDG
jgi:charged multivesicular body protein 2A